MYQPYNHECIDTEILNVNVDTFNHNNDNGRVYNIILMNSLRS